MNSNETHMDREIFFSMKAGSVLVGEDPAAVYIVGENHVSTFNGIPIARAIRVLFPLLEHEITRHELILSALKSSELTEQILEVAFDVLKNSSCLLERAKPSPHSDSVADKLWKAGILATCGLDKTKITVVCPSDSEEMVTRSLGACGIECKVLSFDLGQQKQTVSLRINEYLQETPIHLALCWGFSLRSSVPRVINAASLTYNFSALYGYCNSILARVGPWVLPGDSSCVECLIARLMSNAGSDEVAATQLYGRATDSYLPAQSVPHPAFEAIALAEFSLEASRIIWRLQPATLGAFWERSFLAGFGIKRTILRVPRCRCRGYFQPPKLPWDAILPQLSVLD